jgi:hypothetical protein
MDESNKTQQTNLPDRLTEKVRGMREHAPGVHLVDVVMDGGVRIHNVRITDTRHIESSTRIDTDKITDIHRKHD